jgi:Ca2+-binding EF-hand superfamily protein
MGTCAGHCVSHTAALTDCCAFDSAAKTVVQLDHVEEWAAYDLLKERIHEQEQLFKESPLQYVGVNRGLTMFSEYETSCRGTLSKAAFIKGAWALAKELNRSGVGGEADKVVLEKVFDSIDYDGDQTLSRGEWAEGLTKFFQGTRDEKITAAFKCLDGDGNGNLSQSELKEFITPLVKAMTPPEAASLRPLLIARVAHEVFEEVDTHHDGYITSEEFIAWMSEKGPTEKRVADIIEVQVFTIIDKVRSGGHY